MRVLAFAVLLVAFASFATAQPPQAPAPPPPCDPAGAQFVFADGSVRQVLYAAPPNVVAALLTPSGGEVVNGDFLPD